LANKRVFCRNVTIRPGRCLIASSYAASATRRRKLAELIMSFAAEGENDPKRLKQLALAALPKADSN
jgi:hypothetical protein